MPGHRASLIAFLTLPLLVSSPAHADDALPPPGLEAAKNAAHSTAPAQQPPGSQYPIHTWELPPIDVPGVPKPDLAEEDLVGDYQQPRWSTNRRFPTTRMYVLPKGKVDAEYWLRYTAQIKNPGTSREMRSYYELEFGLGHRLQFDVYLVTQQDGVSTEIKVEREQIEMRYALADWGKIWGNPTLYLEYQHRNGENDRLEGKILLGGQIAPRWHGGFNLVLERELSGHQENEWDLTGGVSYTVVDERFHAGIEAYVEVHDNMGSRWQFTENEQLYVLGPSFMINPIAPAHFLVAPLFGVGKDGGGDTIVGKFRLWFVAGWEF